MTLFLTLLMIPGFPFLFFRMVVPAWNFVLSNIEAVFYLRKRSAAKIKLTGLMNTITSITGLARWYEGVNFIWRADLPILDFSSKPWVSVARNKGDCDDMMMVARAILATKCDECRRAYLYATDGRSHAILCLRKGTLWYVMSNQRDIGAFRTLREATDYLYGSKTKYVFVY